MARDYRSEDLRRRYGLTPRAVDLQLGLQGNVCAICRKKFTEKRRAHVDHDHATGAPRGLLCRACNVGLGMFYDNPTFLQSAISYLTRGE